LLDAFIGTMVLFGAVSSSSRSGLHRTRPTEVTFGLLSGFSGYVAAIGGPPLALLYRDESGPTLRANLAAQFGIGVVLAIVLRALSKQMSLLDVQVALWLLLPMFAGLGTSRWLAPRMNPRLLRGGILVLSGVAGLGLLVRSLWFELPG
jgi:uncharacterized membrane protein YfcA